jgi:HSP20 family protein
MFGLVPFDRRRDQMQSRENNWTDLDRLWENFFNDSLMPGYFTRSGLMKVDIRDDKDAYILEAELPGVAREDINIEIDDGRLAISVNQDEKAEEKRESFIRRERRRTSMCRSFGLENIDADKISAKLENGVLTLRLPKLDETKAQSRKIDIA